MFPQLVKQLPSSGVLWPEEVYNTAILAKYDKHAVRLAAEPGTHLFWPLFFPMFDDALNILAGDPGLRRSPDIIALRQGLECRHLLRSKLFLPPPAGGNDDFLLATGGVIVYKRSQLRRYWAAHR